MGKCGKSPCLCGSTSDEQHIEIPFMGDASITNSTTPEQLATFIEERDKIPILLAMSLYTGTPRNNIPPWELIHSSVTPRTACWIFQNTVIVGCRGTCVQCPGGGRDLADDKVNQKTKKLKNFLNRARAALVVWFFLFTFSLFFSFSDSRLLHSRETIVT